MNGIYQALKEIIFNVNGIMQSFKAKAKSMTY